MSRIEFKSPENLRIPLRVSFTHAQAHRVMSDSVLVSAMRGEFSGMGEGCPRPYVTGESVEGALVWLGSVLPELSEAVFDLESLRAFAAEKKADIDRNPSAWCAAEIAVLDLLASEQGQSVEAFLGLDEAPRDFRYSAVLSQEDGDALKALGGRYFKAGILDFKIRPLGDAAADRARIEALRAMASAMGFASPRVRFDANNLWAGRFDECALYLDCLGLKPDALEEPLAPRAYEDLEKLSVRFDIPIALDESASTVEDISRAADYGASWIVNLKLAKAGGILRSLAIVDAVRARGWPLCLGSHAGETSILTRAALVVARAAGDSLVAQEGAFGTMVLEYDPVRPSLSFGAGGILRWPAQGLQPGLGLKRVAEGSEELP